MILLSAIPQTFVRVEAKDGISCERYVCGDWRKRRTSRDEAKVSEISTTDVSDFCRRVVAGELDVACGRIGSLYAVYGVAAGV